MLYCHFSKPLADLIHCLSESGVTLALFDLCAVKAELTYSNPNKVF